MDLKILDTEHRIAAVSMPERKRKGGVCICYSHSTNMIVINQDAANLDKIVELLGTYMDLDNLERLEVRNYTKDETIKDMLRTMDRIDRAWKHLRKSWGVKSCNGSGRSICAVG